MIATVHHGLGHSVSRSRHGIKRGHVHRVVRSGCWHEVWHHASLHGQSARGPLHSHSPRAAAVELLLVRGRGELLSGFRADGNVAFHSRHLSL